MCRVVRMKTVVLQSFRTFDVPTWISSSMATVRQWAEMNGWSYEFMDDTFFGFAPAWVRTRCAANKYAVTDICRLEWAQRKLAEGYQRVVWADADMLVFVPGELRLADGSGHGFARELFLHVGENDVTTPIHGINNALMFFETGDPVLAAYLEECYACLRTLPDGPVPRTALGPALLLRFAGTRPLRAIERVGLFSQAIMESIAAGGGPLANEYLRQSRLPPAAANLCHFLRNATAPQHRPVFDRLYDLALQRLIQTQGAVLAAVTQ